MTVPSSGPSDDAPHGDDELLAIIGLDHHRLSEDARLEFDATDEEMGTRFEALFESESGLSFRLIQPAYEAEVGVHVHVPAHTDIPQAESDLLQSLSLEVADLQWRAAALHFNQGDIVSIDPDAPESYFPDAVGQVIEVAYDDHPDLVALPDVNPAVYGVRLDNGLQIEVPSNLIVWEPILHAEQVNTASQFTDFLSTLAHHMTVRPHYWNSRGGAPGLLGRLITQIGIRDGAALQAREQLAPRWGTVAVGILEAVAPASWADEED